MGVVNNLSHAIRKATEVGIEEAGTIPAAGPAIVQVIVAVARAMQAHLKEGIN